jgi:four helix bundle protein
MLAYERLKAWQLAHELTLTVYRCTERWPVGERYGLTSRIRRAAAAVPTNLAEGRFVDIALGSISEVAYLLLLARDLGILPIEDFDRLDDLRKRTGGPSWRLVRALRRASP